MKYRKSHVDMIDLIARPLLAPWPPCVSRPSNSTRLPSERAPLNVERETAMTSELSAMSRASPAMYQVLRNLQKQGHTAAVICRDRKRRNRSVEA